MPADPRPIPPPEQRRRRLAEGVRLWGELTLAGVVIVTILAIWHLRRRARLIRDRLGPPRPARWDEPIGGPPSGERSG